MADTESPNSSINALLQPLRTDYLPEPAADAPLFLPADAQRLWYLGFLEHWTEFRQDAIEFWKSENCMRAFDEIKGFEVEPPRLPTTTSAGTDGSELVRDYFQREVQEVAEKIYNKLLHTKTMRELDEDNSLPERIELCTSANIFDDENPVPAVFSLKVPVQDEKETRSIGHVEYLGGRPGALTWAIKEAAKNTWGSLRCVLGDIADWMLVSGASYAFLTTTDEVVFLQLDIVGRTHYVNAAPTDELPRLEHVDVLTEPRLYFSDPIKHTDVFSEAEGTISVRMALMYLVQIVLTTDWQMSGDLEPCRAYFEMGDVGERYKMPCSSARL